MRPAVSDQVSLIGKVECPPFPPGSIFKNTPSGAIAAWAGRSVSSFVSPSVTAAARSGMFGHAAVDRDQRHSGPLTDKPSPRPHETRCCCSCWSACCCCDSWTGSCCRCCSTSRHEEHGCSTEPRMKTRRASSRHRSFRLLAVAAWAFHACNRHLTAAQSIFPRE